VPGARSLAQLAAAARHRLRGAAPAGGEERAGAGQPCRAVGRQRMVDHVRGAHLAEPAQVLAVEDGVEPFDDGPVGRGGHGSPAVQAETAHIGDMAEPVKTRRRFDNPRQALDRAARAEVIAAARPLFLVRGYPASTIEATGGSGRRAAGRHIPARPPRNPRRGRRNRPRRISPATPAWPGACWNAPGPCSTCCAPPQPPTPNASS
jgi:hypothetical protein